MPYRIACHTSAANDMVEFPNWKFNLALLTRYGIVRLLCIEAQSGLLFSLSLSLTHSLSVWNKCVDNIQSIEAVSFSRSQGCPDVRRIHIATDEY